MKAFQVYYPRLDADFTILSDDYTDLVRLCNELRGCVVTDVCETEKGVEEFEDED